MPQLYNAEDYLCMVTTDQIAICQEHTSLAGPYQCDETVFDLCCLIMDEQLLVPPGDPQEGKTLYDRLRREIRRHL